MRGKFKCKTSLIENWHGRRFSRHRAKWPISWISGKVCFLCDTTGARVGEVKTVITRIRRGWIKFRD